MTVFKNFQEMYNAYKQKFPYERVLTSAQRKHYDLKAHVLQEQVDFEFKYVPLNGEHVYLFRTDKQALEFDELSDNVGRR